MRYLIEPIGVQFSVKDLTNLAQHLTARAGEGYRLHSVFQASAPSGCLGFGQGTVTYFAIYEKTEP